MTAKRTDANQGEIVKALRDMKATVQILSAVGKGCPDILIGYRGHNFLAEIKDGKKPPSARKLTEDEAKFHDEWKGHVCILNSIEDAINLITKIDKYSP